MNFTLLLVVLGMKNIIYISLLSTAPVVLIIILIIIVVWCRRQCLARQKAAQAKHEEDVSLQRLEKSPNVQRKGSVKNSGMRNSASSYSNYHYPQHQQQNPSYGDRGAPMRIYGVSTSPTRCSAYNSSVGGGGGGGNYSTVTAFSNGYNNGYGNCNTDSDYETADWPSPYTQRHDMRAGCGGVGGSTRTLRSTHSPPAYHLVNHSVHSSPQLINKNSFSAQV